MAVPGSHEKKVSLRSGWATAALLGPLALLAGICLTDSHASFAAPSSAPQTKPPASAKSHPNAPVLPVQADAFAASVRPFLRKYCLNCHSTRTKQAGLDLERFTGAESMRQDLKPWQGVVDHLEVGDMPPQGSPQPNEAAKRRIVAWVREVLHKEALATAGDPGDIPLRRLSNTEYNNTIRDLTGVDLQPAREFPTDGAAGEGFTNAAEALTDVSPALLTKYLAAAREISEHAVLLPDGLRFAPGKTRRDWTDASTAQLRAFYAQWAPPDGHLDFTPYLAATVRHRADLLSGKSTVATIAAAEKLNARYLGILWSALTEPSEAFPMREIQAQWRAATTNDLPALAAAITTWQNALWQTVRIGSYVHPVGQKFAESSARQIPGPLAPATAQTIRLTLKPVPGSNDITLRLATRTLTGSGKGSVVWTNPRLEAAGKPSLSLRNYAQYGRSFEIDYPAFFASTARYLEAAQEANADPDTTGIAARHGLNAVILQRWISLLDLAAYRQDAHKELAGRSVPAVPLQRLQAPLRFGAGKSTLNGWYKAGSDLPSLLTNSSDKQEKVPGDVAPHSVVVHPSASEFVGIAWTSPITGVVHVDAAVAHAHPACGNGVSWWLERRRGAQAVMFDEGRLGLGAKITPPMQTLSVQAGDTILLAVDAHDGDYGCDLTRVQLKVREVGGAHQVWDLAGDTVDTILAGNPHADRYGNPAAWSFVTGPTRSVNADPPRKPSIPSDSLLGRWRETVIDPAHRAEAPNLALQVQRLLSGPRSTAATDSDRQIFDLLASPETPLLKDVDPALLPRPQAGSPAYALPETAFGGAAIGPNDLRADTDTTTLIRLPAALAAEREFVAEARLLDSADDRAIQLRATVDTGSPEPTWSADSLIVARHGALAYRKIATGFERFRDLFPLYTCFPPIIPNDEVVSLKMFHREDAPLKRLFLDSVQTQVLDRLWAEHLFISQQPLAEQKYLPLFIGFVTQDQPKEMVAFFEGMRPEFDRRAAAFARLSEAAIPKQLAALSDFTARAYRRPLTAKERNEQAALYRSLVAAGSSAEEAMHTLIARVLVAPAFLFRIEQAPAGAQIGSADDWEMATRLSYFLWASEPDAELRRAAAAGKLHTPAALQAQTRRMLQDARVRSLAVEFGAQWLHVRGFDAQSDKNEQLFPTFDAGLRSAIYEETVRFFQNLFQADCPASDLLNADYTFLNEPLAKHYGIPGVAGSQWRKVEGVQRYGRGGILGLATVQASQSGASRTSPILRGNWVSETLLGERLPRPPANVPKLPEEEGTAGLTIRQEVERHTHDPACAGCHRRIDPFGFAFEKYDPIGRFREKDLGGRLIDTQTTLRDGARIDGLDGLRRYLMTTRRDQVLHLFSRRLLGYALGRAVLNSDQPLLNAMTLRLSRSGGQISEAVALIVASPQFRTIRGTEFAQQPKARRTAAAPKALPLQTVSAAWRAHPPR